MSRSFKVGDEVDVAIAFRGTVVGAIGLDQFWVTGGDTGYLHRWVTANEMTLVLQPVLCKSCGKEIEMEGTRWVHSRSSKVFCNWTTAEPADA